LGSVLFYLIIILAVLGTGYVILAVWQTDRDFNAVKKATCVSCGAPFGLVAAKKAQEDSEEVVEEVSDETSGSLVKPTREWPVQCPTCGTRHKYRLDEQRILAEDATRIENS